MENCCESINKFARSKPARIIFAVCLTLICVGAIVRLYIASNQMADMNNRQQQHLQQSANLQLMMNSDQGSLFYFKGSSEDSQAWSAKLDKFLAPYRTPHPNRQKCDWRTPPAPGKVCDVDLDDFGICSPKHNYGISESSACVFLKLASDPTWKPEFYNNTDLPDDMPADLKKFIASNPNYKSQNMAWVSCGGQFPADIENIGSIEYIPERGFHDYQFAKANVDENLPPIMAIHVQKPSRSANTKGILISIECQLWTRNAGDKVHFQIIFD